MPQTLYDYWADQARVLACSEMSAMMRQRGRLCYIGMSHCQPREVSFIGVDRCLTRIGLPSNAQWLQRQGFTIYPLEGYRAVRLRAAELATAKAQRAAPLRGARPAPEGIGALPVAPRAAQVATHGFAPQSQLATYLVEAATQLTIAVQSDHAKLGPTYRTLDTARILTNSATHTALRFTGPVNNPGCHSPALTWPRRDTRVVSAPADGDGLRAAYLVFWAGFACDVLPGG